MNDTETRPKRFVPWLLAAAAATTVAVALFLFAERELNQLSPRDFDPLFSVYVYLDWPMFVVGDALDINTAVFPGHANLLVPGVVSVLYHFPIMAFLFLPVLFPDRRRQIRSTLISIVTLVGWMTVSFILWHDVSL